MFTKLRLVPTIAHVSPARATTPATRWGRSIFIVPQGKVSGVWLLVPDTPWGEEVLDRAPLLLT